MTEQYFEIGKIANTHGLRGELKIVPLTDDPQRFELLEWIYVDEPHGLKRYDIQNIKYLKSFVILDLNGIVSIDQAEKLKGLLIKIESKYAVKLPQDSFFICDIIGCEVFDLSGKKLGIIKEVLHTGSNDVYIVKNETEQNKELLIPALKSVVKKVSIEERKMIVELPKGLVDDEV